MNEDFSNVVIVDGIPIVEEAKQEKLRGVLSKLFSAFGTIKPNGFYLATEGKPPTTSGFVLRAFERLFPLCTHFYRFFGE